MQKVNKHREAFWLISSPLLKLTRNSLTVGYKGGLTMYPCGSGRCLGRGSHPYSWQGVSAHRCKRCEVMCLVPARGTISSPLRRDPAVSPWAEVSHLYIVTAYPWMGLRLSWGRFQRTNDCSFCKWTQWGLLTRGRAGQRRVRMHWSWVRCPPLGVHSPWLPNLPHGCSCCLWMSKEGKPALVFETKAELLFSVEWYILVLYEKSQTNLRVVVNGQKL